MSQSQSIGLQNQFDLIQRQRGDAIDVVRRFDNNFMGPRNTLAMEKRMGLAHLQRTNDLLEYSLACHGSRPIGIAMVSVVSMVCTGMVAMSAMLGPGKIVGPSKMVGPTTVVDSGFR